MVISLDEIKPHPYADLRKISRKDHEREVLILPFCPVKEIRRWKEEKYNYIEVRQNTALPPIFSTDKNETMKFWETMFAKKL